MTTIRTTNFFPALGAGATPLDIATAPENPLRLLESWVDHVMAIEAVEPMFVTLATASASGVVSSRTVQLLAIEEDTTLFTTNFGSRKGVEMLETGRVAVSLYWRETAQSVNFTGSVEDDRGVQASRVASFHGRDLPDEAAHLAKFQALVESGEPIARPDYWKWFRVRVDAVTFWEGHPESMNRRIHYALKDGAWSKGMVQA